MSGMFNKYSSLKSLDLSSFNTNNVNDMSFMFFNCSSLISLNLSSFNTNNVEFLFCFLSHLKKEKVIFKDKKIEIFLNEIQNCINLSKPIQKIEDNLFLGNNINKIYNLKNGIICFISDNIIYFIKNIFEFYIQLTIKENNIIKLIQLKNENILLLCLNEIKIIKLNSLNSYSIIQILTNNQIIDILEIKDLKLISISKDKKLIIWDLNEQNKYYSLIIINIDNNINEGRLKLINDNKFILLNKSNFYKINNNNIELITLNKSNNRIIDIIKIKDLILCFEEEKRKIIILLRNFNF
jgi:surface protein